MSQEFSYERALAFDNQDELNHFRSRFRIPQLNNKDAIYLCGNSLGLQPVSTANSIQQELEDWANLGVEGHVHGRRPWLSYHEQFAAPLARLTGSRETEVVAMNGLTVNLHLLMISFYRPTNKRFRILCEEKAFPSDSYALNSQAALHGRTPEEVIREISPRTGQSHIELSDILQAIAEEGDRLAMILIGGVNYYSGQVFDMAAITNAGHEVGAMVGFDLAHAIGNIDLKLHDWEVDFAAWCSYKYLNSGPGSVAGIYIHEKHASDPHTFRLAGWWGHDKASRFKMEPGFHPIPTAESWQMSNAPVLSMAAHKASLDIFDEAGMPALVGKSKKLTRYLHSLLLEVQQLSGFEGMFSIITPEERGCQLSLLFHREGKAVFDHLFAHGIIADWREPNVIRIAPVPLYNSFSDAFQFANVLSTYTSN